MTVQLTFELIDLVIFLLVAFVAGTAASTLLVRYSRYNPVVNTILGMIGAFLGQYLFDALDITLSGNFFQRGITIADIFIAFMGAVIVLILAGSIRRL